MNENEEDKEPDKTSFSFKPLVSILLTLFLGPGMGHLYIKKYKKALTFIAISLFFALLQAWEVVKTIPKDQIATIKANDVTSIFNNFAVNYPRTLMVYDVIFAAIWAYAIVDAYIKSRETN